MARGRMIYAIPSLLEECNAIKAEEKLTRNQDVMIRLTEHAKVGRELEKFAQGYLFGVFAKPKKNKNSRNFEWP